MTDNAPKIPESAKTNPRCPLCHAVFDRREVPSRRANILMMLREANARYKKAVDERKSQKIKDARKWGERLEASLKAGAAEAFFCHLCRITIACNDPFVGRWDEVYAKAGKEPCPACGEDMRFFATSTGYIKLQCPMKKCAAAIETGEPDRETAGDPEAPGLVDAKGEPIALPGVDRPIATPEQLSNAQAGDAGTTLDLPDAEVKLPPLGGRA